MKIHTEMMTILAAASFACIGAFAEQPAKAAETAKPKTEVKSCCMPDFLKEDDAKEAQQTAVPAENKPVMKGGCCKDGKKEGCAKDGKKEGCAKDGKKEGCAMEGMKEGCAMEGMKGGCCKAGKKEGCAMEGMKGGCAKDGMKGGCCKKGMKDGCKAGKNAEVQQPKADAEAKPADK